MSLRLRLSLLVVGFVAAGLLIADLVTYHSLDSFLTTRVDHELEVAAYPVGRALLSPTDANGTGSTSRNRPSGRSSTTTSLADPTSSGSSGPGTSSSTPSGTASRSGAASSTDRDARTDSDPERSDSDSATRPSFADGGALFGRTHHRRSVLVTPGTYGLLRSASGKVENHLFFSYGATAPTAPTVPAALPGSGLAGRFDEYFTTSSPGSPSLSYRAVAKPLQGGDGVVVVAVPLSDVDSTLNQLLFLEVLVSVLVLAGLGLLSWFMVRRDLRPLTNITATAEAIAGGDLSQRVSPMGEGTEVGRLGRTFNSMLDEIEVAFAERSASEERLRRFLADASHELRTPLTSIRGHAELFDLGVRDRPSELAASLAHIREEARRMGMLVDDLFLLAQLDRERPLRHEPVDLLDVARRSARAIEVATPGCVVTVAGDGPVTVRGDRDRLRQVADNLIVNAVRHARDRGGITVTASAEPTEAVLSVHDDGPGIDPAEARRIFEPFYRSDPSRSRTSGGAGLGLSIVAAIVQGHGGTVSVRPGPGATFEVRLPRSDVPAPNGRRPPEADPGPARGEEPVDGPLR